MRSGFSRRRIPLFLPLYSFTKRGLRVYSRWDMVFTAIMFGCINGTREIVKEVPIYLRERMVNLGIFPYMFSKVIVMGIFCLLQSIFLFPPLEVYITWQKMLCLAVTTFITARFSQPITKGMLQVIFCSHGLPLFSSLLH